MSDKTTNKQAKTRRGTASPEMAREYRLDYRKSRANRFAGRQAVDSIAIVLEPDVAKVFHDPKKVNALLRATITAVGKAGSPQRRTAARGATTKRAKRQVG